MMYFPVKEGNYAMSNVAITGSIIAAHKKNNQTAQQIPRQYNPNGFQVPLPSQNVGRIKFGGWQEDLDDVNMRLSKIHRDRNREGQGTS